MLFLVYWFGMQDSGNDARLNGVLEENRRLLEENNQLLRKLHRNTRLSFWVQIAWYVILIGLPFALYYFVLEPYFTALGSSYDAFNAGIQEIPGWKQFYEMMEAYQAGDVQ